MPNYTMKPLELHPSGLQLKFQHKGISAEVLALCLALKGSHVAQAQHSSWTRSVAAPQRNILSVRKEPACVWSAA